MRFSSDNRRIGRGSRASAVLSLPVRWGAIILVGGTVQGCAVGAGFGRVASWFDLPPSWSADGGTISTEAADDERTPFRLEVVDESNDGRRFIVRGRVVVKADWDAQHAVVRLAALTEGGRTERAHFPLAERRVTSAGGIPVEVPATETIRQLKAGERVDFILEVPAAGLTSYQLDLLWGKDAGPVLEQARVPAGPGLLTLRNLEAQKVRDLTCDYIPCPSKHQVTGELFNAGNGTITRVVLGIALVPLAPELDLGDQIPQNERRIEIRNLQLAPEQAKPLKLVLDREIEEGEPEMRPNVRVLKFDVE
jgi:hypothetical protein